MPGYHIYRYDDVQFDKYEFRISHEKAQIVEGHHLFIMYELNPNVQALQFSGNASRLRTHDEGPTCPAASNATKEGKALNRRVELVKQ